ncbi:MAG: hypothetical protein U1D25_12350 [Hydrogenophaga sp.]|uniref:hypothetical protein n=1 Tax=Hydrogenophaga sp. TaxID=1904254 RepID=UPI002ABA0854|nr:hypothetical protein [Hydrogenophaga sp.]MDZ4188882.1 hypothetical protein [Hydrogenophaga sp.]
MAKAPELKFQKHIADFPVTVIAGTNGSGKSTVLLACACAYDVPGARDHSPAVLFPKLKARDMNRNTPKTFA